MKISLLFIFVTVLSDRALAQVETLTGAAGYPGRNRSADVMIFRTVAKDYSVNLSKLSPEVREQLLKEENSSNQISIKITQKAVAFSEDVPNGIRPDCGELPVTYENLKTLAERPDVRNQMDFINSLPAGTLQNFTFTYKSESAQGAGVSREFPGVIRSSSDGKLVVRYTCDESKSTYGKVEVLTFDDKTKKYKMADFDFQKPVNPHKVTENPKTCMRCHNPGGPDSAPDPRPNWQPYDQWNGFYGSQDDAFGVNSTSGIKHSQEELDLEKSDYQSFRLKQKDNPCYSSLPWPKDGGEPIFPYSKTKIGSDLARRPGLKITVTQCHLAAQRLARRISSKPEYKYIKYALAMKTMGCKDGYRPSQIQSVIPEFQDLPNSYDNRYKNTGNPRHSSNAYSLHYLVGKKMGINENEWTMHYGKDKEASFDCGAQHDVKGKTDIGMGDIMEGELMNGLSQELPGLAGTFRTTKGERKIFGEKNSCLDEEGGAVVVEDQSRACAELKIAQEKMTEESLGPKMAVETLNQLKELRKRACENKHDEAIQPVVELGMDVQKIAVKLQTEKPDAKEGERIVTTVCINCHKDGKYPYFSDPDATKKHLRENPDLAKRVLIRMSDPNDPMPPYDEPDPNKAGHVQEYLKQFTAK